ncbi:MAG: ATP synthase subunit I [Kosmotogaceae bacterium]
MIILASIEAAVIYFFSTKMALGVFYGTAFGITGFWLLSLTVEKVTNNNKILWRDYLIRYALYIVCFLSAIGYGTYFFIGSAVGLLNLKLSLLLFGRWLSEV